MKKEVVERRRQFQEDEITEKGLKKMVSDGIISDAELSYILMTDKQIIYQHDPDNSEVKKGIPKWWHGKDGRWRIKFGGKIIAKTDIEDLKKAILDYYLKEKTKSLTVDEAFKAFIEERKAMCSIRTFSTEKKYKNDFKRFFAADEDGFSNKTIDKVSKEDISLFFKRTIERLNLSRKAFGSLYDYTNGLFEYCVDEELLLSNPCQRVKKQTFYSLCHEKDICLSNEVASDEDVKRLHKKIEQSRVIHPSDLVPLAFEFCMLTGSRRSEPCGLKWSDFMRTPDGQEVLCIQRRVVEDREHGKDSTIICNPKGNKMRLLPLTEPLKELFNEVKNTKSKFNISSEWIFGNGDAPMSPSKISNYGRDRKGFKKHLTPTMMRKAFNSRLKTEQALSTEQTAALLGNSILVNNSHYTYDIGNMDRKASASENEQKRLLGLRD